MGEEERLPTHSDEGRDNLQQAAESEIQSIFCCPVHWLKMHLRELHWSFVFGVTIVYGVSQGLGGALARVGTEYYMKDVQKVQPSEAQVYTGITSIPWIVKPLWVSSPTSFRFRAITGGLISFLLGVYGLLTIPAGLLFLVGVLLKKQRASSFAYKQGLIYLAHVY